MSLMLRKLALIWRRFLKFTSVTESEQKVLGGWPERERQQQIFDVFSIFYCDLGCVTNEFIIFAIDISWSYYFFFLASCILKLNSIFTDNILFKIFFACYQFLDNIYLHIDLTTTFILLVSLTTIVLFFIIPYYGLLICNIHSYESSKITHSHSCWQKTNSLPAGCKEALVPHQLDLSVSLLECPYVPLSECPKRGHGRSHNVLISEVTHAHFGSILFIRSDSLSTVNT